MRRHPRAPGGILLALLLLSTAALAQSRAVPQSVGPAPGAPLGVAPVPLSTAVPGAGLLPTQDTTSAFALWWGQIRGNLPGRIRAACIPSPQSVPEIASWCQRYQGPSASEFDLEALLDSDALVLAAYFSERRPLFQALDELDLALEAVRRSKTAPREQQEAALTTSEILDAARGHTSLNAGVETATSLPGLLPGIDLNAFLDQVFTGLAGALQERAEAEAVLYVLVEFDERICKQEVKDQWGQRQGHIRDWLPATCTAAHNNAFASTLGAGGAASLALLRKTVEQDLRSIPSHLVFEVVAQADGRRYERAALPVREMVDSMVSGVHPVRALDTLSRRLETLPLEPGLPPDVSRLYTQMACVSGMPASFTRYTALVDDANRGLVPQMDANARGLAVLLLSLQKESCGWVYAPAGKQSRLKIWAAIAPPLSESAEGVFTVAADLQRLVEQAGQLSAGAQNGGPERIAEATRLLAQQGVSALDAAHVALDGLLHLNRLMGAWLESSGAGAAEQVAQNQKALLEARGFLSSSRDVLRMVVAAIARDLSTVYQLLLEHQAISSRTARYDDGVAKRCVQEEAWKAPSAAEPEARTSEWRCERRPCICLPEGFARYGGLLVSLADAKDAQEVKAVVLASASPVGSWRWRSDPDVHRFVSLGGLVGLGGSYSLSGPRANRVTPRLLVPVGLDYQLGGAGLTWSAFFQVIDLAGYTQFVGVEERKAPRVMEAVSPGLWLKGMIPRTPVSLSLGAAYDLDAGGVTPAPSWRFSAGVSIDTPLFLLYRN
ncbi:MAG TPA: hypothetical protein VFZ09_01065 [Archangium sp.]|uniref:hypothetical protein n=1 Tax=Archangium sp. TaxID=1872627 RepID=UPI002E301563|nr:hypothetical protein [Archangium sp.]HEX5744798.1 hypothetical protein [Archangium sp.]